MAGSEGFAFDEVGRLPAPGDNVAIATRRIEGIPPHLIRPVRAKQVTLHAP